VILLSPIVRTNATLYQIEFILLAIMFCFTGILTRSKLRGFLNFIPAFLSYLTIEILFQGLFDPPLANPYGTFNFISEPLSQVVDNVNFDAELKELLQQVLQYLLVIDLLFIWIIAFFGGFFASTVATGFWNKHGDFKFISVIAKMIAIPMAIIFLIVLPIILHAVSSVAAGGSYIAAGGTELALAFGITIGESGGTGAQDTPFDINNLDMTKLREHSANAAKYFSQADVSLQQLKGNFIVGAIMSNLGTFSSDLEGYEDATVLLDVVGVLSEATYAIPDIFQGFKALQVGFENTFQIIGDEGPGGIGATNSQLNLKTNAINQVAPYNPNFVVGLQNLAWAFDNFSLAWKNNETGHGLEKALFRASTISEFEELDKLVNLNEFVDAINTTVSILLSTKDAILPFINGTYKTILGMKALGQNAFSEASDWISKGIENFSDSNRTLAALARPKPVNLTINPGRSDETYIAIPIDGIVEIAGDLNNLLLSFGYGVKSGIDFFVEMDIIMKAMDDLDMSNALAISNATFWNIVSTSVVNAQSTFNFASSNITEAGTKAGIFVNKSYGEFLDPAFTDPDNSRPDAFFRQIADLIVETQDNMTDFGHLLNAIGNTTFSFRDFGYAAGEFDPALTEWVDNSNSVPLEAVRTNFTQSRDYAEDAYNSLESAVSINPETKSAWKEMLGDPAVTYDISSIEENLRALSTRAIETITLVLAVPATDPNFQAILDILELLDLDEIFG
jgi:hypothetical protein